MSLQTSRQLQLVTRVVSILFIGFTALFAFDVFGEHRRPLDLATNLLLHLLPTIVLLVIFLLSLKREWVGGIFYLIIAFVYTVVTLRHPSWILTIAGPLYLMGTMYCVLWCARKNNYQ